MRRLLIREREPNKLELAERRAHETDPKRDARAVRNCRVWWRGGDVVWLKAQGHWVEYTLNGEGTTDTLETSTRTCDDRIPCDSCWTSRESVCWQQNSIKVEFLESGVDSSRSTQIGVGGERREVRVIHRRILRSNESTQVKNKP